MQKKDTSFTEFFHIMFDPKLVFHIALSHNFLFNMNLKINVSLCYVQTYRYQSFHSPYPKSIIWCQKIDKV